MGKVPGRIFKTPVVRCTKEQFIEEVKAPILSCQSLNLGAKAGEKLVYKFFKEKIEIR